MQNILNDHKALAHEPRREERAEEASRGKVVPRPIMAGGLATSLPTTWGWGRGCIPSILGHVRQTLRELLAEMGKSLLEPGGTGTGV